MKKALSLLLAGVMCVGLLAGCGGQNTEDPQGSGSTPDTSDTQETGNKTIDTLRIAFVPSREPDEIITATEPLKQMLTDELAKLGYDVGEVDITVGTSYEAVGEALSAGTADVGLIPGGTYVLYDDGCDVLLTATRDGLSIDSDNAKDWNDGQPTEASEKQAVSYRALIIAGPSDKGQELAAKVNAGEALTWEDVSSANWSVANSSSPAGYIYPSLWLQEHYGKGISNLDNVVECDSHTTSVARLAAGQVDVMVSYGHIRIKNAPIWESDFDGTAPMVEQTGVIGVTDGIYNDMIAYSKTSDTMADEAFRQAVGESFIELAQTEEGQEIFGVFSQVGYDWGSDSDYDGERAAQALLKSMEA